MSKSSFGKRLTKVAESMAKTGTSLQRMTTLSEGVEHMKGGVDSFMARMSLPSLYSHRNGETEQPVVDSADLGLWFWYDGLDYDSPQSECFGMFWVSPEEATDTKGSRTPLGELRGRWWGPITPPWEQT